jgi:hypothetical protein
MGCVVDVEMTVGVAPKTAPASIIVNKTLLDIGGNCNLQIAKTQLQRNKIRLCF